jgi:hypothetical protein
MSLAADISHGALVSAAPKRMLEETTRASPPPITLGQHLEGQDAEWVAEQACNVETKSLLGEGSGISQRSLYISEFIFGANRRNPEKPTESPASANVSASNTTKDESAKKCDAPLASSATETPGFFSRFSRQPEEGVEQPSTQEFWKEDSTSTLAEDEGKKPPAFLIDNSLYPQCPSSSGCKDYSREDHALKRRDEKDANDNKSAFNLLSTFTNDRWGNALYDDKAEIEFNVKNLDDGATEGMLLVPHLEDGIVFDGWG